MVMVLVKVKMVGKVEVEIEEDGRMEHNRAEQNHSESDCLGRRIVEGHQ